MKTGNSITNWLPRIYSHTKFERVSSQPAKYESRQNSKIQVFHFFSELREIWKYSLK